MRKIGALVCLLILIVASCTKSRQEYYRDLEQITASNRSREAYYGDSVAVRLLDSTLVDIRKQIAP